MDWFYADNGQQLGPFPEAEFERIVQRGTVTEATLVWHSGMADWQPYSAVMHEIASPQPKSRRMPRS